MTQHAFDHWWSTLSDPSYAERCRRKNSFRQRQFPTGNYQVDEDVWARHPTDGYMYVASVVAVDRSYRTCSVTFVDDGETVTLPVSHLRHVTRDDIENDRYVDYGRSWTEHTQSGTIITYNRYGEEQSIRYSNALCDLFDYSRPSNEYHIDIHSRRAPMPLSDNIISSVNNSGPILNEPIWIRIPDPVAPAAAYSHCPIWNASSFEEAEQQAFKMLQNDLSYLEELQRARHRPELRKLVSLLLSEVNLQNSTDLPRTTGTSDSADLHASLDDYSIYIPSPMPSIEASSVVIEPSNTTASPNNSIQLCHNLPDLGTPLIESSFQSKSTNSNAQDSSTPIDIESVESCSSRRESSLSIESSSSLLVDKQLLLDNTEESTSQRPISIPISNTPPVLVEHATQTDSFAKFPVVSIENTNEHPLFLKSTKHRHSSKRRCSTLLLSSRVVSIIGQSTTHESKHRLQHFYVSRFLKHLTLVLLTLILIYRLLSGLPSSTGVYSAPTTMTSKFKSGVECANTMAVFFYATLSFSINSNGPSRSWFERWHRPFAVP